MLQQLTGLLGQNKEPGERELAREAKHFSGLLSKKLEQLNICYRYRKSEKDLIERGVQRVRFDMAVTQDEALWFRIDTSPKKFPRGVSLADINDDRVLNDLSVSCSRPVRFRGGMDGAWLVIERESGVFGIRAIDFTDMMDAWPKTKRELIVPLGLAHNRRLVFKSLDEFPHALIGGATKSGKTTLTHAWICALALKNPSDLLKLVLIDLKGGVEFTRYKTLPHMWHYEADDGSTFEGFVKDRDAVIPVLELLREEMDKRLAKFERAGGVQHIAAWNYRHREKLPRIVVFLDELASLMLEPDLKKDAERILADLGARGRAPGIHLVIATQRPEVSVVSGRIKGNLDARFGFRVPDNASSMVVLDDTSAAQFSADTPRGRFIFKFGNDRREVQGPWIGPGKIRGIVKSIITGDAEMQTESARVDPEDVFRIALQENGGAFSILKMFDLVKGRGISKRYLESLGQDYEGEIIEIDGELYELQASTGQFEPRRLVKVTGGTISESQGDKDKGMDDRAQQITVLDTAITENAIARIQGDIIRIKEPEFRIDDVFKYALETRGGSLAITGIYPEFVDQIKKNDLEDLLKECDSMTVTVEGHEYWIEPGAGRRPRRLVKIEEAS